MKKLTIFAFIALLCFTVAFAQKKKQPPPVTTYWTVTVEADNDPLASTIVGGYGNPDRNPTYDPMTSPYILVSASPSNTDSPWNWFDLKIYNLAPYATKPIPNSMEGDVDPLPWITFKNIVMQVGGQEWFADRDYTENSFRLAPELIDGSYEYAIKTGPPDCFADFLNLSPHPRQFYENVQLHVSYQADPFVDMEVGEPIEVYAAFCIRIRMKYDCNEPLTGGIYGSEHQAIPEYLGHKGDLTSITRTDVDEWEISLNQPVLLIENGPKVITVQRGKKTFTDCDLSLNGGHWTEPIKTTLIFKRYTY